jgi:hypothetical protein
VGVIGRRLQSLVQIRAAGFGSVQWLDRKLFENQPFSSGNSQACEVYAELAPF